MQNVVNLRAKCLICKELGGGKGRRAGLDAGRFLKIFLIFWFLCDFFVFCGCSFSASFINYLAYIK